MILAQKLILDVGEGQQEFSGPLVAPDGSSIDSIGGVINIVLPFLFSIAGILLFLFLAWGGYEFLLSQGSPEKIKAGRAKITSALIGFLLLVFTYLIVKVLAKVFGLSATFL